MQRPVYITSCFVLAPGIYGFEAFSAFLAYRNETLINKKIDFDVSSPFYPQRSDLKAMREDVVASVIAVSELLKQANIPPEERENIGLFTSTGICFSEISSTINTLKTRLLEEEGNIAISENKGRFFDAIPPLTALRTLTNAIESYASLYSGLAGENTTFGGTSAGGFYALQEAFQAIESGKTNMAVAGSANFGENLWVDVFRNFSEDAKAWKSTTCAAFLLLESEESLTKRKMNPLVKINRLKQDETVPRLFGNKLEFYKDFAAELESRFCVFSGGMNETDFKQEKHFLEKRDMEIYSLFPSFGNTNSASVFMSVAAAIALQKQKGFSVNICLERDVYNREFLVELDYEFGL